MALRVVVNADDLGLHVAVRRAVERLRDRGRLTSASVLANGPDVVASARVRGVSLGAHLNILRGRPLSPPREIPSLVRADGLFLGSYGQLYRRYLAGAVKPAEVELEWSRQVERLLELGARLSHADGEKHTQCWPTLLPIAVTIAARYRLPFLRIPRERLRLGASWRGYARVVALRWWLRSARAPFAGGAVRATDDVWGIANHATTLTAARFAAAFRPIGAITSRSVEIVCHPGDEFASDGDVPPDFGRMRVRSLWTPELRALADPGWDEALLACGGALASFDDLASSTAGPAT
ncbi:MAG: ChbG/HpnK family deacetylase [Phycisphaerae bacterium]|nr:ChbG/HpnK family deacetylase [Phycisphaerae bacterium]